MKRPFITFLVMCLFLGVFAYLASLLNPSTPTLVLTQKVLYSISFLFGTWITIRFFNVFLWPYIWKFMDRVLPQIVVTGTTFIFMFLAFLVVVGIIFEQPITGILAASGLLTAALAISLQSILLDFFSAIIIDTDRPFKIGDWIVVKEHIEGEVIRISWRHTEILTHLNTIIFVPNGDLLKEPIVNYTRASGWYLGLVEFTVDHDVPVSRVRRIIHAALYKVTDIIGHHSAVNAFKTTEGGIVYTITYALSTPKIWRSVRHKVIDEITTQLHRYDLKISERVGEYTWSEGREKIIETPPVDKKSALQQVDIFASLAKAELTKLTNSLELLHIPQGTPFIQKGETDHSLFIIAEGVAAVQLTDDTFEYLHEGSYVGERGLLLGEPRDTTVTAKTDLILYKLDKKSLKPILEKNTKLIDSIAHVMTLRYEALMKAQKSEQKEYKRQSFKEILISAIKEFFQIG